jgi:type IV secretion system protein VirB1
MIDPAFSLQCAPTVAPATIEAIVRVESRGDPLALYINGDGIGAIHVTSIDAAVAIARQAVAAGYTVDIGLMGLNTRTLQQFHVSIEDAFDRCTNLRIGGAVLTRDYLVAVERYGRGEMALEAALSAYNTGDFERGRGNGYLAKYFNSTKHPPGKRPGPNPYTVASLTYTFHTYTTEVSR